MGVGVVWAWAAADGRRCSLIKAGHGLGWLGHGMFFRTHNLT